MNEHYDIELPSIAEKLELINRGRDPHEPPMTIPMPEDRVHILVAGGVAGWHSLMIRRARSRCRRRSPSFDRAVRQLREVFVGGPLIPVLDGAHREYRVVAHGTPVWPGFRLTNSTA